MTPSFPETELRDSIKRAFKGANPFRGEPFILFGVPELRNPFLRETWNLGVREGWLKVVEVNLEQETYLKGYLTDKGRKDLGL